MSESIYSTREILEQFADTVWFPLVLGMKHTIKALAPLLALLAIDGKLGFRTNRRRFDKFVRDFEHCVITYVTTQMRKDLNVISQMAGAGNGAAVQPAAAGARNLDRDLGQATWIRDYFGDDRSPGALAQLDTRSRDRCKFLQGFSNDLALRKCNLLFATVIVSFVQRTLQDTRDQGTQLSWFMVKRMVRVRLPDDSPRMIMETFMSMTRPDGMDVTERTSTGTLVRKLLLTKVNLDLPKSIWTCQMACSFRTGHSK